MSDSLGLSIGMTNLVAARMGRPPVMRRSVLTLFEDRAAEVGVPAEYAGNPSVHQPGIVHRGRNGAKLRFLGFALLARAPQRGAEEPPGVGIVGIASDDLARLLRGEPRLRAKQPLGVAQSLGDGHGRAQAVLPMPPSMVPAARSASRARAGGCALRPDDPLTVPPRDRCISGPPRALKSW